MENLNIINIEFLLFFFWSLLVTTVDVCIQFDLSLIIAVKLSAVEIMSNSIGTVEWWKSYQAELINWAGMQADF